MNGFTLRDRVRREDSNRLKAIVERCGNFSAQEAGFVAEIVSLLKTQGRRRSGYRLLALEAPGGLAAFVLYGPRSDRPAEGDLYWIATDPAARGRGFGKVLIAETERRASAEGIARLFIETEAGEDYAAARRLSAAAGYDIAETVKEHYGAGRDQVIYVKSLS